MRRWKYSLNIKEVWNKLQADEIELTKGVAVIVEKIREILLPHFGWDTDLEDLIMSLESLDDEDIDSFDAIWDDFYDWADQESVWVETF